MKQNRSSLLSACNGSWPCGLHLNRTLKRWRNHITCSFACMRCVFVLLIFLSFSWPLTWPSSRSRLPPCYHCLSALFLFMIAEFIPAKPSKLPVNHKHNHHFSHVEQFSVPNRIWALFSNALICTVSVTSLHVLRGSQCVSFQTAYKHSKLSLRPAASSEVPFSNSKSKVSIAAWDGWTLLTCINLRSVIW